MKRLAYLILCTQIFCFTGCSQNSQKIGIDNNGKYIITSSLDSVKLKWNQLLKQLNVQTGLAGFEIVKAVDSASNNQPYYMLLGKTKDNSAKIATLLSYKGGTFYLKMDTGGSTCTCTGCTIGCNPILALGSWTCTSCKNEGTCVKSATAGD